MIKRLLIIAILFAAVPCFGANYYIDPDWGGTESGTYAQPYDSFTDLPAMSTGDDVYLKYGTEIHEELVIDWSGIESNRVIIGCYDGNGDFDCTGKTLPIMNGGKTVSASWTQHATNEYYTTVTDEVFNVWQNGSWVDLAYVSEVYDLDSSGMTSLSVTGDSSMDYTQAQVEDAYIGIKYNHWTRKFYRVNTYNNTTKIITVDDDAQSNTYSSSVGYQAYHLYGLEWMLDAENEWFYCSSSYASVPNCATGDNRLYLYQTGGGSPSGTITYAVLETAIEAVGQDYITIRELEIKQYYGGGIYFSDSHKAVIGSSRSDGVYIHHIQAGKYVTDESRTGFAIRVRDAWEDSSEHELEIKNVKIDHCNNGIASGTNYTNFHIHDNTISNIAVDGVENASLWKGQRASAAIGLKSHWSVDPSGTVEDNTINGTGYVGIAVSGHNFTIQNNTISNTLQDLTDGGSIYSGGEDTGSDPGGTISGNVIINACSAREWSASVPDFGIYLDAGNQRITVTNNTIDADGCRGCLENNRGGHNTWTYNTCTDYEEYGFLAYKNPADCSNTDVDGLQNVHSLVFQNNILNSQVADLHVNLNPSSCSDDPSEDWFDNYSDMNNNTYYPDGAFFREDGVTSSNLAAWKSSTSLDSGSAIGDINNAIYINPDVVGGAGDGSSDTDAYDTIKDITFDVTKDYYLKCDTTDTITSYVNISGKDATLSNRMVIGSYYMDGSTEVIGACPDGQDNPIIERSTHTLGDYVFVITNSDYLHMKNLDIRGGYNQISLHSGGVSYLLIEDSVLGKGAYQYVMWSSNAQTGEDPNNYGVIRNCTFDSAIATSGATPYDEGGTLQDAIFFRAGHNYWEIYNNDFIDWPHAAVTIEAYTGGDNQEGYDSSYNKVYNNHIYRVATGSYDFARGIALLGDTKLHHNEFYNNHIEGMTVRSKLGGHNNQVYYNLFDGSTDVGEAADGILIGGSDFNGLPYDAVDNQLVNNVFVNIAHVAVRLGTNTVETQSGNIIANNIMYNCGNDNDAGTPDYRGISLRINGYAVVEENEYYNNLIYNDTYTDVVLWLTNANLLTVAEFNALNGTDSNVMTGNVQTDPSFVSASNFNLQSGSGAINTGKDMSSYDSAYNTDYASNTQDTYAPWEIGAYVYQSAAVTGTLNGVTPTGVTIQ